MEFVYLILTIVFVFFLYYKWSRQYWAKKNVPTIETSGLWGNVENPLTAKRGLNLNVKAAYDEFRKMGHKHGGIYLLTQPGYMPIDRDLIKQILTKDFAHFTGHGFFYNEKKDPLSAHLFNLDGEEWRDMRIHLTPTFTSGKMKMMFSTLLQCGVPMMEHIDELSKSKADLDIKEILGCYTTDIIGSCAFGLECNSFKDPNAEFRKYGRAIFTPSFSRALVTLTVIVAPAIRRWFYLKFVPDEIESFFINAIKNIMGCREANNVERNDFVQLFIEMKKKAKANGEESLTLNQISAQSFVFFLAGFETSSTTMTFCLHELAFNQDVQDKLREEIRETMKQNEEKLTYDGIMEMKYMDQVINETLRKFPPVAVINRICTKDYKVPDTDVVIEKGTKIFISTLGLHRDEEYYPDPDKFDPDRFSKENKAKRPAFTFLPFGEGPRICIGLRFGVMQAKTGLAMILNKYRILPGTNETYNFDFDPRSGISTKKGKVLLNAVKLDP